MEAQDSLLTPEENEREQLIREIRAAFEVFPEFTPESIDRFFYMLQELEDQLNESLLCTKRVAPMLHFLKTKGRTMSHLFTLKTPEELMDDLLLTVSVHQEFQEAKKNHQEKLLDQMQDKFSQLCGTTPSNVQKLMCSIQAVLHKEQVEISKELVQPFLKINTIELEDAIAQRGEDAVFPEIVHSFYIHMQRVIAGSN